MIEVEETAAGLQAQDVTKTAISIHSPDWQTGGPAHEIPRPVDTVVSGRCSELRMPPGFVSVAALDADEQYEHGNETEALDLPDGEYLLNLSSNIKTYVRVSGPLAIKKTEGFDQVVVSLSGRTRTTLGFRSHHDIPVSTVTVPKTPFGVATAVSNMSASFKATGADRSYPTLRGHPPELEFGDEVDIPESVREKKPEVGIEFVVPDDLESVLVAAPLAYYLQAEMRVEPRDDAVLRAPSAGVEREFDSMPQFQHEVADLLRRVFFLDCLVRNAGPYPWDLAEQHLLDETGLDAERVYKLSPAEQLSTYLSAPIEQIEDRLPEWHLSMYVDDTFENTTLLPYLLDNMSLIYRPESSELDPSVLLDRSLGDFYRGRKRSITSSLRTGPGPVDSVDRRDPVLHRGRTHGWLADGVPIDVFKPIPEAYENRAQYLNTDGRSEQSFSDGETESIDVIVVLNDESMEDEHKAVADIYKERAKELPITVSVYEDLTCDELAAIFEQPHDFVHYIGHCEKSGLRCADGNLSVADIEESNVRTFFLNACGSYYEGERLVEKGSVAGAVTFTKVLNKQAAKVGVSFAQLLINGFSIQFALQLARRRIMMGKDYMVVGDGTYVLTQSINHYPLMGWLQKRSDGFDLRCECCLGREVGGGYELYLPEEDRTYLHGSESTYTLNRDALLSYLSHAEMPIVFDGELYWSEELMNELG